jgi:aspartate-semialdehyde dehydrogenase
VRENLARLPVAVIGATGAVGQRFIQLLDEHPWFELIVVAASDKSTGKKYQETVKWHLEQKIPKEIGKKIIEPIDSKIFKNHGIKLIFSALPADVANDLEPRLAFDGFPVFSNASAHRMKKNVPLLIADVNPEHLELVEAQKVGEQQSSGGFLVTNPNCAVVGLATVLKPIVTEFGVKNVNVTTYQAISGAGYPGVPAWDIQGNILPFIPNEEQKVEEECQKILGKLRGEKITPLNFGVIASCARVPVRDGHLEAVVVEIRQEATKEMVIDALSNYSGLSTITPNEPLPTAPEKTIIVTSDEDRPQPMLDWDAGSPERAKGMAVVVGRIKILNKKLRLYLLVHNTIRGAAGCSILNAELARLIGYL